MRGACPHPVRHGRVPFVYHGRGIGHWLASNTRCGREDLESKHFAARVLGLDRARRALRIIFSQLGHRFLRVITPFLLPSVRSNVQRSLSADAELGMGAVGVLWSFFFCLFKSYSCSGP